MRCPECGGYEMNNCSEGVMCRSCGLMIDDAPLEEKPFVPDSIKINASLPGQELVGTMPVNGKIVRHEWLLTTQEKNIFNAKRKLELIASKQRLPKTVEDDAFVLFRRAVEKGINVGRKNTELLYGCVYASCIIHNIPKTAIELTAFTDVTKTKMLNAFKLIKNKLRLKMPQIDPIDFVCRFGSRLNLKQTTMTKASEIIMKLKNKPVVAGKNPNTIVASALYLAVKENQERVTQREISNITGVVEVTIRKRSREMLEFFI